MENIALWDLAVREEKKEFTESRKQQIGEEQLLQQQIWEVSSFVEAAVDAALLLSGFHKHKGQWRKKRHG